MANKALAGVKTRAFAYRVCIHLYLQFPGHVTRVPWKARGQSKKKILGGSCRKDQLNNPLRVINALDESHSKPR